MIDFFIIFQQPFDQAWYVDGTDGHAISSESDERTIVGAPREIVKGLEARGSLRDFIESEVALQADLNTYLVTLLIAALGLAHMHSQAGLALELFFAVLADVAVSLRHRVHGVVA